MASESSSYKINSSAPSCLATQMNRLEKAGVIEGEASKASASQSISHSMLISEGNTSTHNSNTVEDPMEDPPISLEPKRTQNWLGAVVEMPRNVPVIVTPDLGEPDGSRTHEQPCATASSGRSSPLLQDLSVSPLTASSFHVMEKEYDRDTWKMYKLIQTARCDQQHHHQEMSSSLSKLYQRRATRKQRSHSALPHAWTQEPSNSSYGHFVQEDEDPPLQMELSRREEEEEQEEGDFRDDEIFDLELDT